jgi:hypothetical protein
VSPNGNKKRKKRKKINRSDHEGKLAGQKQNQLKTNQHKKAICSCQVTAEAFWLKVKVKAEILM